MDVLPLQQHPRFAAALRALGQHSQVIELPGEAARAVVVWRRVPLLGELGYLPRGPSWHSECPEVRRAGLDQLTRLGVRLVEAETPCPTLWAAGFRQVATPAHVAELDLTGGRERRLDCLNAKWRGSLRQALRSGLRITWTSFDGDPSHWLLRREAELRRRRRYRALPQSVACAYATANPGAALILAAHDRNEPVAGMMFLLHAPVATYQIGWTGDQGRATSAHHLLLMEAAERLSAEGYVRLDLGSVDTEANPGLARFKIGVGARVRPLGGSWLRLPFARRLASDRARV